MNERKEEKKEVSEGGREGKKEVTERRKEGGKAMKIKVWRKEGRKYRPGFIALLGSIHTAEVDLRGEGF